MSFSSCLQFIQVSATGQLLVQSLFFLLHEFLHLLHCSPAVYGLSSLDIKLPLKRIWPEQEMFSIFLCGSFNYLLGTVVADVRVVLSATKKALGKSTTNLMGCVPNHLSIVSNLHNIKSKINCFSRNSQFILLLCYYWLSSRTWRSLSRNTKTLSQKTRAPCGWRWRCSHRMFQTWNHFI